MKSPILPNALSLVAIVLFLSMGTGEKSTEESKIGHDAEPIPTESAKRTIWETAQAEGCRFFDQDGNLFALNSLVDKNVVFSTFVMPCSPANIQPQFALARVRLKHPDPIVFISLTPDHTHDSGKLLAEYAAQFSEVPGTWRFLRGDAKSCSTLCKLIFGPDHSPASDLQVAYFDSRSDQIEKFGRWNLEFLLTLKLAKHFSGH